MKLKKALLINENDFIVNLGFVDKVELAHSARFVALTITGGLCMSAAFYWFHEETDLLIDETKQKKTPAQPT